MSQVLIGVQFMFYYPLILQPNCNLACWHHSWHSFLLLNIHFGWIQSSFFVSISYAVSVLPKEESSKEFLSLFYESFLWPIFTYASSRWLFFSVLPTLLRWNAFTKRPAAPSPASYFLVFSLRFICLHDSFEFRLPAPFSISDLTRQEVKPSPPRQTLYPLHRLYLRSLLSTEKLFWPASFLFSGTLFLSAWSSFFTRCDFSDPPFSRQDTTLAQINPFSNHELVIWSDSIVPSFGKCYGFLAKCSLCGTEAILSYWGDQVCSSFSAEASATLQALSWSRKHQQAYLFSAVLLRLET